MSPFSEPVLTEIKKRSKGRSELSGRTDRPLHCSHFNHKRDSTYNSSERGIRCTITEHLAYHILYRDRASEIGLKECQNDWAIDMLNRNTLDFLQKIGKEDEFNDELADSIFMWESVL